MSLLVELLPTAGKALVVGGGSVAERKVRGLVDAGFAVTVVAPGISAGIRKLSGVELRVRPFAESDVPGHALVFACTSEREVNRQVGEAARSHLIPVVVADRQDESTFFTPAVHRDGDLTVAVATNGASPVLAQEVRNRVAVCLGTGWAARVRAAKKQRLARLAAGRAETPDE